MEFKEVQAISQQDLFTLYNDAGWAAYTKKIDTLEQAIKNSLVVYTAWENEKLIGLTRAIGDGVVILYMQDILVLKEFQNQGIGEKLVQYVLEKYPVRQNVLLTNDAPNVRHFYEKLGFKSADQGDTVAFYQ